MKKLSRLFKYQIAFLAIGTIYISSINGSALAETQNPYEDTDFSYNSISSSHWENTDVGEYPISLDSEEWCELSSMEAHMVCDMPEEYAKGLTTEELVEYAVNYPFLMDVLAFDKLEDGMKHLEKKSGVFKELFARADAEKELIKEYKRMDIDYKLVAKGDSIKTDYDSQMFIEEYMGLNYDLLSRNEIKEFVKEYGKKYEKMNNLLDDSKLTTIFYECIQESMGEVPTNAIPDTVEASIIESTDIGGASFTKISSSICARCGQSQQYGTIIVDTKKVYAYKWIASGYSDVDIKNMDSYMEKSYPSFKKLRSATGKYNCHSYAWYKKTNKNKYWISNPANIYNNTNKWTPWRIPMRTLQAGDRITFWNENGLQHSAIVNSSTKCTSKIGHYGLYKTTITEMKDMYEASTTKAFIPN